MPVARARRRNLIIGIDFGTSTTKVVWHDTSNDDYEVMKWDSGRQGIDAALLPSELAVHDGRVYLGFDGARIPNPSLRIPWIKICVLCEVNPSVCRQCGHAKSRGKISVRHDRVVSARTLACALLSWVFSQVEKAVRKQFPGETLHLTWNVGCPIDHMDKTHALRSYETMAQAAWELRDLATNPMPLEGLGQFEQRLASCKIPPPEHRTVYVRPETHAGIMAFLQSPHADEETYVLVDVGAGTTDVSMFIHGRNRSEAGAPFNSNYLGDGTAAVGGDDVDRDLAARWGIDTATAKRRKENRETVPADLRSIQRIYEHYRGVCSRVPLDRMLIAPANLRFELFTFGGGSRLTVLHGILKKNLPHGLTVKRFQKITPPKTLRTFPGSAENYDLLAVACGLSSSVLDWDRITPRTEVKPIEMPKSHAGSSRVRPDRDELYPK